MCGICGKLIVNDPGARLHPDLIASMMEPIRHRGPDDEGVYISGPVGLGHRRLSIIDLNTGQQPISNEDGTVWVVFNGEIYNYKELTAFLVSKGHHFRTTTDTEVLVHLYEEYGEQMLPKLRGMFGFAIWDDKAKTLLVARDRLGIKPIYYHWDNRALLFASEIKAILADPSVTAEADPAALLTFLTYFYPPGETTLFKGINKLSPGHYLTVKNGELKIAQYWDLRFDKSAPTRSLKESMGELTELLRDTVHQHMISDVPVGVLLSGGVDSTAMLSFAVEQTDKPVSTFTIGFDGNLCTDERQYARIAADKYGTNHYEMSIRSEDFLDFLPKYVWHMEEPVCEPPAIALYYVSKLARDHGVKVLISGEGGDEAFAGYQNYRNLVWLERIKGLLGPFAKPASAFAGGLATIPALRRFRKYAPLLSLPLEKYYYSRTSNPFQYFNRSRTALFTQNFLRCLNGSEPTLATGQYLGSFASRGALDRMLYVDTKTWLPDDLLIKADRMTMANSVELRVPLLDHRVLEFAAALPARFKLRGFTMKYILKKALAERVPAAIRNRKKTGFPVPYEDWLRKDLKQTVWSVLTDPKTAQRGYFRPEAVEGLLVANSKGSDYSAEIFSLLILELWHRTFADGVHSAPRTA
ncbi:MAG TPA: asparagine synthase (glutamine-hydrolyzing) [Terriglobia bacterium]|nr:asparagine synthase (glutamine-hydrolyzing) [Terriglobia bacterium]